MKRWQLAVIFVAGALIAFGVTLYMGQQQKAQSRNTTHIALRQDAADPSLLGVKVGQYVQFDAKDSKSHSLTQGTPPTDGAAVHEHAAGDLSSGEFKSNEAWRLQFKKAGSYSFYDELNPKIQVTVIAYEPKK